VYLAFKTCVLKIDQIIYFSPAIPGHDQAQKGAVPEKPASMKTVKLPGERGWTTLQHI
jgi:hypothetical protein